jgi:MYXO-CTERM domain-containing protein
MMEHTSAAPSSATPPVSMWTSTLLALMTMFALWPHRRRSEKNTGARRGAELRVGEDEDQ